MSTHVSSITASAGLDPVALRAAQSAVVQRRRGARQSVRELYYDAHSLLRALRQWLLRDARAA